MKLAKVGEAKQIKPGDVVEIIDQNHPWSSRLVYAAPGGPKDLVLELPEQQSLSVHKRLICCCWNAQVRRVPELRSDQVMNQMPVGFEMFRDRARWY